MGMRCSPHASICSFSLKLAQQSSTGPKSIWNRAEGSASNIAGNYWINTFELVPVYGHVVLSYQLLSAVNKQSMKTAVQTMEGRRA